MANLKDILMHKWASDHMAHFYILQAPSQMKTPASFLKQWAQDFISDILTKEKNLSKEQSHQLLKNGHADLLFIEKEDKQKDYSVGDGDFNEFFRFLGHRNYELKRRFIIVSDAHLINKIMANKLLKTLEEPPVGTTIFFLRPSQKSLLATISSRAILLNLTANKQASQISYGIAKLEETIYEVLLSNGLNEDDSTEISHCFKDLGTPPFLMGPIIDMLKNKKHWQSALHESLITIAAALPLDFHAKSKLLNKIKWFEKSNTFNNSMTERMTALVMALHHGTMSLDKSKQN